MPEEKNFSIRSKGIKTSSNGWKNAWNEPKKRKYNDILVHLATIGKAMEENPDETIELTIT